MGKKLKDHLRLIIEIALALVVLGGIAYNEGRESSTIKQNQTKICSLNTTLNKSIDAQNELKIAITKLTLQMESINEKLGNFK